MAHGEKERCEVEQAWSQEVEDGICGGCLFRISPPECCFLLPLGRRGGSLLDNMKAEMIGKRKSHGATPVQPVAESASVLLTLDCTGG